MYFILFASNLLGQVAKEKPDYWAQTLQKENFIQSETTLWNTVH